MRLLDRHIVREYVRSLFAVGFILTVLMFLAIVLEHIDDAIEFHSSFLTSFEWFLMILPERMVETVPIIVLLGVMFSIGNLSRHNEIIAIVSTGISRTRIFMPILGVTALMVLATFLFSEIVVPNATRHGEHIERVEVRGLPPLTEAGETFIRGAGDTYYWMERYLDHENRPRMIRPAVLQMSPDRSHIAQRIDAETAVHVRPRAEGSRPQWRFRQGTVRTFSPDGTEMSVERFRDQSFDLEDDLREFLSVTKEPGEMNFIELKNLIEILNTRPGTDLDEMRTELHLKIAFPLALLIIALLAFPFAMKTRSGSMFVGFSMAIMWIILFYAFVAIMQGMGHEGHIWPWAAAWLPNAVFVVVAAYFSGLWRT